MCRRIEVGEPQPKYRYPIGAGRHGGTGVGQGRRKHAFYFSIQLQTSHIGDEVDPAQGLINNFTVASAYDAGANSIHSWIGFDRL
jgi:hypothetical protein